MRRTTALALVAALAACAADPAAQRQQLEQQVALDLRRVGLAVDTGALTSSQLAQLKFLFDRPPDPVFGVVRTGRADLRRQARRILAP